MTRRSSSVSLLKAALLVASAALGLTACQSESVGTAQEALTAVRGSAQTCEALGTGVHGCMATLHTCVQAAADAAAIDACKAALAGCIPADPPNADHDGMGPGPHGGGHHGTPGGGQHGTPGGGQHGTPGGGSGGPHGGGDMAGGCPGMGGGMDACNPGAPLIEACKANLDACLAAGAGAAACVTAADACVAAAIQDRFKAMCEARAAAVCDGDATDAVTCDQLDRACNDGVTLPDVVTGTVKIRALQK